MFIAFYDVMWFIELFCISLMIEWPVHIIHCTCTGSKKQTLLFLICAGSEFLPITSHQRSSV